MKKRFVRLFVCIVFIAIACNTLSFAERPNHKATGKQGSLQKTTVQNQFTMTGNNWAFEMTNYGPYAQDIAGRLPGGGSGGEFPRGTGTYIIFAAGLQIGALVDGVPKVSVIDFDSEFQPGALEKTNPTDTTEVPRATDAGAAVNKLFALYKDGSDGTPVGSNGDAMDDFVNWPKQYGAPVDKVGNPLIIGDLMSWCVYNDIDPLLHRLPDDSQKDPLGLEVQQASIQVNITGYSDVFFMYWKVINKGTKNLSDVYISAWFDPDVDNASNDLIATDTLTNMVFTYNADNSDPVSLGGSAFGADFFQGPIVNGEPTDVAKYLELTPDGFVQRVVPGKKVLGLSSTVRYINVRGAEGDPDNDKELYNLMRGLEKNGDPKPSRFTYPADPLTAPSSELDPRPDDKRMMLCTGPFNLAVGDTQVVVLACVGGKGTDKDDAIKNLRLTDKIAQQAYDSKFLVPQPPPSPKLTVTPLDGQIVLQWNNSSELTIDNYPTLANVDIPGYTAKDFAGYKVYRSPSGTVGSWTLLKQFDKKDGITEIADTTWVTIQGNPQMVIKIISIGDDKGLQYTFSDEDVVNGQVYYYAVTAYDAQASVVSGTAPRTLESTQSINAIRAVPRVTTLGNVVSASSQETAEHVGSSDGKVLVSVVDPTAVTGHTYKVLFEDVLYEDSTTTPPKLISKVMWKLFDVDSNKFVKFNKADDPRTNIDDSYYQDRQASEATGQEYTKNEFVTVDGLMIKVFGPSLDFKNFEVVANGSGPLSPLEGGAADFAHFPSLRPTDAQQVGPARWLIHTADNGTRAEYEAFTARTTRGGSFWRNIVPYDFEIRFTANSGWAYDAYNSGTNFFQVPFELWNIGIGTPDNTSDDYRLIPWLLDDDSSLTFNMGAPDAKFFGTYDHTVSGGDNDPYTDWIYWQKPAVTTPGQAGYLAAEAEMIAGTYDGHNETEIMARMVLVSWNGDTSATPPSGLYNQELPEIGTIFRITTTKPNSPADTFTFKTSAKPAFSASLAAARLNKHYIKVVPNPYYGFSAYDQNQFNRRIKITGLPDVCTMRIFNVAGDLVRTINHNSSSNNDRAADENPEFTSIEIWDLTSDNGLFISSGVYFIHIDAPGIGTTKEPIPFAIIQGNVQLTVPTN